MNSWLPKIVYIHVLTPMFYYICLSISNMKATDSTRERRPEK